MRIIKHKKGLYTVSTLIFILLTLPLTLYIYFYLPNIYFYLDLLPHSPIDPYRSILLDSIGESPYPIHPPSCKFTSLSREIRKHYPALYETCLWRHNGYQGNADLTFYMVFDKLVKYHYPGAVFPDSGTSLGIIRCAGILHLDYDYDLIYVSPPTHPINITAINQLLIALYQQHGIPIHIKERESYNTAEIYDIPLERASYWMRIVAILPSATLIYLIYSLSLPTPYLPYFYILFILSFILILFFPSLFIHLFPITYAVDYYGYQYQPILYCKFHMYNHTFLADDGFLLDMLAEKYNTTNVPFLLPENGRSHKYWETLRVKQPSHKGGYFLPGK